MSLNKGKIKDASLSVVNFSANVRHKKGVMEMSMPGAMEVVVILLVVLLLFGAKRLPEMGRALGEGIREFKKSLKDGSGDSESKNKS